MFQLSGVHYKPTKDLVPRSQDEAYTSAYHSDRSDSEGSEEEEEEPLGKGVLQGFRV